ncbi:putative WRKY transcription factor 27 [Iris pallida]|uniref:WRKY transcription factor 27 n=1 Tax=Iris pallida TaxID=29817 RepID=A0AAX6F4K5_IRIPA|nr:putative WRKY transcription factor 27 [Iris pallida]
MAIWWSETNNWDLHAVVRGCSSYSTPTTSTSARDAAAIDPYALLKEESDVDEREVELSVAAKDVIHELEELCKPYFRDPDPKPCPPDRASSPPEQPQARRTLPNSTPRNKKRKNQQMKKVVCQVPANGVSSDLWAWRKYGQKPIKGSPYPRGYYRCSSSKGCMARKQVERSRTDPSMLVLTYTAEHDHPLPTHRNSLAGSTRNKFPTPSSVSDGGLGRSECCSSLANYSSPSMAGDLLAEELMEKMEMEQSVDLGGSRKHSGSSADDSEEEDEDDFVKSFFSSSR